MDLKNIDKSASQLLASNRTERSRKCKKIIEAFGGSGKKQLDVEIIMRGYI